MSSDVKQVIFDFRFLALLAVGGSLAGSFLCFLNVLSSALLKTNSARFHYRKSLDTYYNKKTLTMQLNSFWMMCSGYLLKINRAHIFLLKHFLLYDTLIVRVVWLLLACLKGCVYICDAYKVYWSSCVKGIHTGQMVLRLVEAIGRILGYSLLYLFFVLEVYYC